MCQPANLPCQGNSSLMQGGVLLGRFDLLMVFRFTEGTPASSNPIHGVRLFIPVPVSVGLVAITTVLPPDRRGRLRLCR